MLERFTVKALSSCNRFSHDEGATSAEFGMLTALIAVAIGVAMITFGANLSTDWDNLGTHISNLVTSSCKRLRC